MGDPCANELEKLDSVQHVPSFIHMCHNYQATDPETGTRWAFHKGHVPAELFDCDVPLIVEPPKDLLLSQKSPHDRRSAWKLCAAIRHVNGLAVQRRKERCGDGK